MEILRIILTIVYIIACIGLVIVVLMQEGKAAGLGSISGAAETYWQFHGWHGRRNHLSSAWRD